MLILSITPMEARPPLADGAKRHDSILATAQTIYGRNRTSDRIVPSKACTLPHASAHNAASIAKLNKRTVAKDVAVRQRIGFIWPLWTVVIGQLQ